MVDYNNDYDSDGDRTSKYNSGIAQIYRLDALWKDTHKFSRAGKLSDWNWTLDRIWCELAGDIKIKKIKTKKVKKYDDEDEEEEEEEEDLEDKRVSDYEDINVRIELMINKGVLKSMDALTFRRKLYTLLNEKELYLRRLQNELGKGTAFSDGSEDDWD